MGSRRFGSKGTALIGYLAVLFGVACGGSTEPPADGGRVVDASRPMPSDFEPVEMTLREIDGQEGTVPISVAHVFRPGQYFPERTAVLLVERDLRPALQVDVLRRHGDGSIRHALFSFVIEEVRADEELTVRFLEETPPAPEPFRRGFDPSDFDLTMTLEGDDELRGALRDVVTDPSTCEVSSDLSTDWAYLRFDGEVMKECVVWGHFRLPDGSADPLLDFSVRVTTYTGWDGAYAHFVVENTRSRLAPEDSSTPFGTRSFDAVMTNGSDELWSRPSIDLYTGTRFVQEAHLGDPISELERVWDLRALVAARAFFMRNHEAYDVPYGYADSYYGSLPEWPDPGVEEGATSAHRVHLHMPGTGGRDDIGPRPRWDDVLLTTMSRRAFRMVRGINANPVGSNFEIHYRRSADPDDPTRHRPGGATGLRCGDDPTDFEEQTNEWVNLAPVAAGRPDTGAPGTPDAAHQPSIGFTAYLLTGQLYYLEEMHFWVHYSLSSQWPYACRVEAPARALAWAGMRGPTDAAWITPDGDTDRRYFDDVLDGIIDWLADESYRQEPEPFPHVLPGLIQPNLTNPGRLTFVNIRRGSPWQTSWAIWGAQLMARRHYAEAVPVRDWMGRYIMNLYTAEDDPAQDWTGPNGQTWRFPSEEAMPYDIALRIYDQMTPCFDDYPSLESEQPNANTQIVGEDRPFENFGELYYWTLVNVRHAAWPQPNWCPEDGQMWGLDNGLRSDETLNRYNWHTYGANPGVAAIAEAVMDSNPDTRSDALPRALDAWERNAELRPTGLENEAFILIPSDPN